MARVRSLSTRRAWKVLAVLLAASGCWWIRKPTAGSVPDAPPGEIALHVTNHNYLDVTIYVVHDGQRNRVGSVSGSSSQLFFLSARLFGQHGEIELLGDPVGSRQIARTERLTVQPGQYIEWTLETDLRRSTVGVY